jgi:hypothetical protein
MMDENYSNIGDFTVSFVMHKTEYGSKSSNWEKETKQNVAWGGVQWQVLVITVTKF